MWNRIVPVALIALGLAACGRSDEGSIYADVAYKRVAAVEVGKPLSYVGHWAASLADCSAHSWALTDARLTSPAGMDCAIVGADPTPAGYSANSYCKGPAIQGSKSGRMVMTLTGTGPGDSLSLSEGPFANAVSLVRCPA